ncbi:hypothetical protein HD554DRAFT_1421650 [Boletus coccyginus]|nr:hypothetical protein HD554DRAFT_1421650 [Boletus coccyginus]
MPSREDTAIRPPAIRHGTDDSAADQREHDGPNYIHSPSRSPHGQQDHDSRNRPSSRRHSPPHGVHGILLNGHSGSYPDASSSAVPAENWGNNFRVQSRLRGEEKGNSQAVENRMEIAAATDAAKSSAPKGDNSAATLDAREASTTRLIDGPPETGDEVADDVAHVRGGSSANPPPSRKRLGVHVHPRNRTLSESVQAYLTRPAVPRYPPKKPSVSGDEWSTTGTHPALLLRLTDGPTGPDIGTCAPPCKTAVGGTIDGNPSAFVPDNDTASRQRPHGRRSQACVFSSNCASLTGASATIRRGGHDQDGDRGHSHDCDCGATDVDTSPVNAPASSHGDAAGVGDDDPLLGSSSGTSRPTSTETQVASALERRLRAQARVHVRLAAIKGSGGGEG